MTLLSPDVLVAGGGPAGLAAALAAARAGARVVLLERQGVLGGLATVGRAGTVGGLYLRSASAGPPAPVAGGFLREFAVRLAEASASAPLQLPDGLWVLPYPPRAFEHLADDLLRETPSVEPILHACLTGVDTEGSRVSCARALAWGDVLTLRPGCVVDCTGEATAAALAGSPTEDGFADQSPGLVFALDGVDPSCVGRGLLPALVGLRRAVREGLLSAGCERLSLVPADPGGGRLTLKLTLGPAAAGVPRWRQITTWEREGRARIDEIERFLADRVEGFRHARVAAVAGQIGVRAGRRARGHAVLSDDDVTQSRTHADGVARGCWPMERWDAGPRPTMTFSPECARYEIRLGCLRPVGLDNVFVAGRCLSAEAGALASARVIGTALATGWAAGTAAACVAGGATPESAVDLLRRQMEE